MKYQSMPGRNCCTSANSHFYAIVVLPFCATQAIDLLIGIAHMPQVCLSIIQIFLMLKHVKHLIYDRINQCYESEI